jgi:hypothetical protein
MGSVIPPTCRTQPKSRTWGRAWVAFIIALLVLALAAPADAKKKKKSGGKKGKTPSGKTTGGAKPAVEADDETDEASSDEKAPTPSKPSSESGTGGDDKPPAPADAEEVTKQPAKADKPVAESDDGEGSGLPALQFGIGGKALFRTLSWTDDNGVLAPYSLSPGPEVGGWFEVYPAAFMTTGFAANIGIFGSFNYGIGAKSRTAPPANTELTTKYQDFLVGLKVRIPLGMFNPYVSGAYGVQTFKLEPGAGDRPNFSYSFIRPGAGVRIQATPMIDIDVGAGFLLVNGMGTAAGELKSAMFFPRATATGIDAGLSIGVRFSSLIGVRAGADFRQYGVTSGYQAGDPVVAGGATDRYITAWGGVELLLDGVGGGPAGGGDEEAAPAKKAPPKKAAPDEFDEEKTEKE